MTKPACQSPSRFLALFPVSSPPGNRASRLFPATITELYAPGNADDLVGSSTNADEDVGAPRGMPAGLRAAHDRNDQTLERIYIGHRFRNDTERQEKLFELYRQMAGNADVPVGSGRKKRRSS